MIEILETGFFISLGIILAVLVVREFLYSTPRDTGKADANATGDSGDSAAGASCDTSSSSCDSSGGDGGGGD
ncbi:hypothetical protein HB779_12165 [Phyllobacterium sp. 628]|uniref:hypothetical protein n=1 Tax=Phyllobacterium sp. 628 TaxID=2718938 RepID=UPI00166269E0|nr:hypothetical protein [Phyllobacterium sp. 628]QND52572.1 hypothetical protein HB779_12165 [Phyllobacterium sp. 628]